MATVLVTGANKGVGLQLTRLYAEKGDKVIACCRNPDAADDLNALAEKHDIDVREVQIGDDDSVAALAKDLEGVTIDILINNAGMAGPAFDKQTASVMDTAGWMETFNVNTVAPVRVLQALKANLAASDNPRVMTVTSQYGAMSFDMPMAYAYSTTKAAVNKFMKLAALELGKEGFSIGLVHPGWVQTDMGGPKADLTPTESATGIVDVIEKLSPDTNGSFWKWDGEIHAW